MKITCARTLAVKLFKSSENIPTDIRLVDRKSRYCQKITMKITEPWKPELSEKETEIIERIKKAASKKGIQEKRGKAEARERREDEKLLEFLGIKKRTSAEER